MAGFPTSLDFTMKKNAVASRLSQQVYTPISGGNANPGDIITISPGVGHYGSYIDPSQCYISFQIKNTDATNALVLDGSAYSAFDRIITQSSSAVISDLQQFPGWAQIMLDSQLNSGKVGFMSAFAGTATDPSLNTVRAGASIAASGSLYVSLPLMGTAIDQTAGDKLIPAGALSDLQLMFYVSAVNNLGVTSSASASWTLANITLTVGYVTLDASAQKMIDDQQGGEYKWSVELWKGYNYGLPNGSSGDSVIVPFKGSSLKSIAAIQRLASNFNNPAAYLNVSRINSYATPSSSAPSSWFVAVGSDVYPPIAIKNTTQHAVEYLKMWHGLGVPSALVTSFDATNWIAGNNVNPALAGSMVTGLNLEVYSGRSGVLHSGVAVLGGTTLVINQLYATALPAAVTQTTYCGYDAVITVKEGIMSVAF